MSPVDQLIERMAEEALAEIRAMCQWARVATENRFKHINRSRGQLSRWAKARALQKGETQ